MGLICEICFRRNQPLKLRAGKIICAECEQSDQLPLSQISDTGQDLAFNTMLKNMWDIRYRRDNKIGELSWNEIQYWNENLVAVKDYYKKNSQLWHDEGMFISEYL